MVHTKSCVVVAVVVDVVAVVAVVVAVRMFVFTSDHQIFAVYSRSDMSWVH